MMDVQEIIALAIVAAAAVLLLRRYAGGRRKPKFRECADCAAGDRPGGHSGGGAAK